ncbi:Arm DNA-binding domain-containing protein [Segnochrobactraceae bacterium EtOH-i3]
MSKLTKRIVDAATPRETGSFFIWCSDLKGFGVRVWSTGKKSYVADYRTRDGERRRLTIGNHGPLTTDDARKQAMLILADAIKGEDPLVDRATRRNALTLAELCDSYLEAA